MANKSVYVDSFLAEYLMGLSSDKDNSEDCKRISNALHHLIRIDGLKFVNPETNQPYTDDELEEISEKNKHNDRFEEVSSFAKNARELYIGQAFFAALTKYLSPSLFGEIADKYPQAFDQLKSQPDFYHTVLVMASERDDFELEDMKKLIGIIGQPVSYDVYHNIRDNTKFDRTERYAYTDTLQCVEYTIDD